jgi:hypothetical protein
MRTRLNVARHWRVLRIVLIRSALALVQATFAAAAAAQVPCTDLQARQTPGRWVRGTDDLAMADRSFPKARYPALFAKTDRVIELLEKATPDPPGLEAKVYRTVRGASPVHDGPLPYGVNAAFLGYYCVPAKGYAKDIAGKVRLGDETGTWIYVDFNTLGWLGQMALGSELKTAGGAAILRVPRRGADLNGSTLYLPEVHSNERTEAIVLAADGRSPYKPISRERFLDAREKRYDHELEEVEKRRQELATMRDRDLAALEARKMPEEKKAEQRERSRKSYEAVQPGLTRRSEQLQSEKAAIIAAREALSPGERGAPAIVKDFRALPPKGKLFATEAEGGWPLATLDPDLFGANGPREAIKVITVYWRWTERDPAKAALVKQFKERFDFQALKQMLGH